MRPRGLLILVVALWFGVAWGEVNQPVEWEPGMYWTYQVRAVGNQGVPPQTMTFYVVAERSLLWVKVYALAQVLDFPPGLIGLFPYSRPGTPIPQGWPFLLEHRPGLPGEPGGIMSFSSTAALPGEGTTQYTETALPLKMKPEEAKEWLEALGPAREAMEEALKEGRITEWRKVTETQTESVTVPAGTFHRCRTVHYSAHYGYGAEEEGTAWWSSEVGWWVKLEGTKTFAGKTDRYIIELIEWGKLSQADLVQRLAAALKKIGLQNPVVAEAMRSQLQKLGIELPK